MTATNQRYGLAICAVAGVTMAAGSWAAGDKPSPNKATTEDKAGEALILNVLEDMFAHQRQGMMNVTPEDGRLLRVLTEATGAKHVVEIGTSNGYSTIWFCLALRSTGGKITTYEINARRASLARENFKRAGVAQLVTLVEGDAHKEVTKLTGPIDILFLDADKAGYIDYLDKLLPRVRPGGLVLAHNTTDLGSLMQDYIKAVTTHRELETIFLHTHDRGIGVSLKKRTGASGKSARASADGVLGYINHIPPESPEQRVARRAKVAERRQRTPIMVHRGDRKTAPENTLEAYAAAMDLGADGVEIDIRRSTDRVLYLFHDDELDRLTKGSGKVNTLSYYELLKITPKDVYGTATPETRPPTLAAFLVLARQRAMLLHLDVKEPGLQDQIEKMLDAADVWDHIVEVNARNAERLRAHPKVKLLPYKGWAPESKYAEEPDAIRHALSQDGTMIFCKDPRPVIKYLKRQAPGPVSLPDGLRCAWMAAGAAKQ